MEERDDILLEGFDSVKEREETIVNKPAMRARWRRQRRKNVSLINIIYYNSIRGKWVKKLWEFIKKYK